MSSIKEMNMQTRLETIEHEDFTGNKATFIKINDHPYESME